MTKAKATDDGRTVTVRVPISIRRRGGRRLVVGPDGIEVTTSVARRVDNAMVKAIARAFRWRDMLENHDYATIREIAHAEKINESYVGRILRLTLLAPDVVEAALSGSQPQTMQLENILKRFSVEWRSQQQELGAAPRL